MKRSFLFFVFISSILLFTCCHAYDAVVIDSTTRVPTEGGFLTIIGSNFVQAGLTPKVELWVDGPGGSIDCEISVDDLTNNQIVCSAFVGSGAHMLSVVELYDNVPILQEELTGFFNFSFEAPQIHSIVPPATVEEGVYVTVIGKYFGNEVVESEYGTDSLLIATVDGLLSIGPCYFITPEQIACVLPPGVGSWNEISISVGPIIPMGGPPGGGPLEKRDSVDPAFPFPLDITWHQTAVSPFQITYTNPYPSLDSCFGGVLGPIPYTEGLALTICGNWFNPGPWDPLAAPPDPDPVPARRKRDFVLSNQWSGVVRVTVGGQPCGVTNSSIDSIICNVPSNAVGNAAVVANINGIELTAPFTVEYTMGAPVVTSVYPTTLNLHSRSLVAGRTVTVYGYNFGPNTHYYTTRRTIHFGKFACTTVKWIAEGVLSCVFPPNVNVYGQNLAISITVAGLSNDVFTSPVLDTTVPDHTPNTACAFPNGAIDTTNFEICNCFSGFAPSAASENRDCSVSSQCPGQIIQQMHVGGGNPSRPHTTFTNDRLIVIQKSPIVHNRRDYHLWFVNNHTASGETCNYPGPIWTKTVSTLDCLDIYTLSMAWSQNEWCGFAKVNGEPQFNTYAATLVTVYREIITSTNNEPAVRSGTVSHAIVVKFERELTIALESTNILPIEYEESDITVEITEDALYDPATLEILIEFDTITNSPYQPQSLQGYWRPAADNVVPTGANVSIVISLQSPQPGFLECSDARDTCSQRWVMHISTVNSENGVSVCNMKGTVDLVPTMLCRDSEQPAGPCPVGVPTPLNATIAFASTTDLCEESSDDVDAAAGLDFSLNVFEDADFAAPQSTFQPFEVAYIQVAVVDSLGTIDAITFNTITLSTDAASDELYDVNDISVVPPSAAHFNITSELVKGRDEPLSPGSVAILSFRVTLTRQLNTLSTLSADEPAPLSVHVVADIVYHGNDKRTLLIQNSLQKSATARIVVIGGYEETDEFADEELLEEEELDGFFSFSAATTTTTTTTTTSLLVMLVVVVMAFVSL